MATDEKFFPKTNGGRLLKRGRSFDPECHKTTHRLRVGNQILHSLGIEETWPEHDEKCILNPKNLSQRCFGYSYRCECAVGTDPSPTWPEWVEGDVFDKAYDLASATQSQRGAWHQHQINEQQAARRAAERAARRAAERAAVAS